MRPLLKGNAMKSLRITTKPSAIDTVIDDALYQLKGINVDSDEYTEIMNQISELYRLKEKTSTKHVSPDTLAIIVGNLAGIVLILGYERAHVVTSKALSFVIKPR